MKKFTLFFLILLLAPQFSMAQGKDTVKVMVYNLLNFPNGRGDCTTNTPISNRIRQLRDIIDYTLPDVFMVCEIQDSVGGNAILNSVMNANGRSGYEMVATWDYNSNYATLNNALFYNSAKLGLVKHSNIATDLRKIGVYQMFSKQSNNRVDTVFIDLMMGHLKAGNYAAGASRRARACDSVRKYIDTASVARNVLFGGDFNIYTPTEAAFQKLTTGGNYPLNDPINAPSYWHNNYSNSYIHTQATRRSQSINCGATGGIDDRFDMMLIANPILYGTKNVRYIPYTYKVVGNNGSTYNKDINDLSNTSGTPQYVLDALYNMSDHLPVVMDLEITQPESVVTVVSEEIGFSLYPNPALSRLNVSYKINNSSLTTISVLDMFGKTVFFLDLGIQSANNSYEINIEHLPQGIYSVIVNTGGSQKQQFFVKK